MGGVKIKKFKIIFFHILVFFRETFFILPFRVSLKTSKKHAPMKTTGLPKQVKAGKAGLPPLSDLAIEFQDKKSVLCWLEKNDIIPTIDETKCPKCNGNCHIKDQTRPKTLKCNIKRCGRSDDEPQSAEDQEEIPPASLPPKRRRTPKHDSIYDYSY